MEKNNNLLRKVGLVLITIPLLFIFFLIGANLGLEEFFFREDNLNQLVHLDIEMENDEAIKESTTEEDRAGENTTEESALNENNGLNDYNKDDDINNIVGDEVEDNQGEGRIDWNSFGLDVIIKSIGDTTIRVRKEELKIRFKLDDDLSVQINPITEREKAIEEEAQKYLDDNLCPTVKQEIVEDYRLRDVSFEDIKEGDKAHIRVNYENNNFTVTRIILLR